VITLELCCVAIVGLWLVSRLWIDEDRAGLLTRFGAIALSSWTAEETCIRAYRFYEYSPSWSVFIGHVPLLVVLIWPVVIHSAWDLARWGSRARRAAGASTALVAAAIVLADASLIEPIAVRAELWHWNEPGLFGVPIIGLLGWAFFAFLVISALERRELVLALILAPIGTHILLVSCWWLALAWVRGPIAGTPIAVLAWLIAAGLTFWIVSKKVSSRLSLREMLLRIPAAFFFFVLLAIHGLGEPALVVYALAFVPPYIVATPWRKPLQET